MLKYEIEGGHLPVVICYPQAGQTLCTQTGAMSWMSPNMQMQTNSGGGIKKMLGRLFSGDSIFLNEYTPMGGSGMIAFASSFPGSIIPYEVTPGNGIIVQKCGFLAMEKGLELSVHFQKSLGAGIFGRHARIWLGMTSAAATFAEDFLQSLADMDPFSSFTSGFYRLTLLSFLQTHANPANCRHQPPGFTDSGLPATQRVHSFHDAGRL